MSAPQTHNPNCVHERSDEALVARAQFDPAGFDAIFDRYWNPVLRYCYYRLGDWHQAEDAAAQVFLNALAALPGFVPSGQPNAFKAWLFTIAFRVVSNLRRAETRHPQAPIEAAADTHASEEPLDFDSPRREDSSYAVIISQKITVYESTRETKTEGPLGQ